MTYGACLGLAVNQDDRDVVDSAVDRSQPLNIHLITINVTATPIGYVGPSNVEVRADICILMCAITVLHYVVGTCRSEGQREAQQTLHDSLALVTL